MLRNKSVQLAGPAKMPASDSVSAFLPVLNLAGRQVLVVGDGAAAACAAGSLLGLGALVKALCPAPGAELQTLIAAGNVQHTGREFSPRDLQGIQFVVAADEPMVNGMVRAAARAAGISCADLADPAAGEIEMAPALALGPALLAVRAPSPPFAAALVEKAAADLGPGYAELAALAEKLCATLLSHSDVEFQRRIMRSLLDSDVLSLIRAGETAKAEAMALRIVGQTTRALT